VSNINGLTGLSHCSASYVSAISSAILSRAEADSSDCSDNRCFLLDCCKSRSIRSICSISFRIIVCCSRMNTLCCSTTCTSEVCVVGETGAVIIPIVVAGRPHLLLLSLGGRAFLGADWEDAVEAEELGLRRWDGARNIVGAVGARRQAASRGIRGFVFSGTLGRCFGSGEGVPPRLLLAGSELRRRSIRLCRWRRFIVRDVVGWCWTRGIAALMLRDS
jgi:hypothetical protein